MSNKFLIINSKKAQLPELNYYYEILSKHFKDLDVEIKYLTEYKLINNYKYLLTTLNFEVIFNLIHLFKSKRNDTKLIIDIRSASLGPLRTIKDFIKIISLLIINPNYIIFLNKSVEKRFYLTKRFLKCKTFLIDMPITNNLEENYSNKKIFRIFAVIKSKAQFSQYLLLTKRITNDNDRNKRDLLICNDHNLRKYIKEYIIQNNLNVEFSRSLNKLEYYNKLSYSKVHFIPYPNKKPYINQTSTRLLDSIASNIFVVTNKTIANQKTTDYFAYHKFIFFYKEFPFKEIININIPNDSEIKEIQKKVKKYKKEYKKGFIDFFKYIK